MSDASPDPRRARTWDVIRERPVAALIAAQIQFTMVHAIQATALGKQIYDISGRALDLGWLGLAEFAPSALLVLVTGWVADRFDKRRVCAIALGLEMGCSIVLAVYAASEPTSVAPLFFVAVGFGVARAFHGPAERALKPLVAPPGPDGLSRVVAIHSSTWQIGAIGGPVLAGVLYAQSPVAPYVAATVFAFGAMLAMLWLRYRNPPTPSDEHPTLHAAVEGLRFIRHSPVLLGAISLDLFAVLFGGAVALLPAIATDRLHVGPVGFGFLRAAPAIGAAITALVLINRPLRRRIGVTLLSVVGVFGAATIALGVTHVYAVAFVALAVLSAADMVSVFIRATIVPLATPISALGRVHAVEQVFIGASNELGAFESGVAAAWLGLGPAVVLGGVATLVVVAAWATFFPQVRDIDRFEDLAPDDRPLAHDNP